MKIQPTIIFLSLCLLLACNSQPKETTKESTSSTETASALTLPLSDYIFGEDVSFPQCHASTLIRLEDGQFLVAWFGGTHEKHDDVGIWLAKGRPGNWSAPQEIAKIREDPHWNPVLFQAEDGEITLFFKVGKEIDYWETWIMKSTDGGENWSEAEELVAGDKGGRGPVRNKPILLSNGDWIAGSSDEKDKVWNAFVDISTDQGKSWEASAFLKLDRNIIVKEGVIQPTLWESEPGVVHMLLRSSAGMICRSDSEDYGKTWSPIYTTELPNPNSGIDVAKLDNGTLALVYNRDDENWGARAPLSVALSFDNGQSWPRMLDIAEGGEDDEFSYPAIISFGDTVAVTYTWQREKIAFWMGTVDEIPSSPLALESQE